MKQKTYERVTLNLSLEIDLMTVTENDQESLHRILENQIRSVLTNGFGTIHYIKVNEFRYDDAYEA